MSGTQHMTAHLENILIVDDDPIQCVLIEEHLLRLGAKHCAHASTGDEAKRHLVADPQPDLITLDLVMPGLDGFGLLEHLRYHCPDIPILIISGSLECTRSSASILAKAYGLKLLAALPKPITGAALEIPLHQLA
jgi:CheY-like chemotaxis protein